MSDHSPSSHDSDSPSPSQDQLRSQIAGLLSGELAPAEAEILTKLLAKDSSARAEYQHQVKMHAMLHWRYGTVGDTPQDEDDPALLMGLIEESEGASREHGQEQAIKQFRKKTKGRWRGKARNDQMRNRGRGLGSVSVTRGAGYTAAGLAAAALVLIFFLLPSPEETSPVAQVSAPSSSAAKIVKSVGARWSDAEVQTAPGAVLPSQPLTLEAGIVEIGFDDGATVVLESPASIELLSANSMRIERGKLVGKVPPSAIGFMIETPVGRVVDLGTEFGVDVAEGALLVNVFEGEVQIDNAASNASEVTSRMLAAGEAAQVRAVDGKIRDASPSEMSFVRRLPEAGEFGFPVFSSEYVSAVKESSPILYWRFESAPQGVVRNSMSDRYHARIGAGRPGSVSWDDGLIDFSRQNSGGYVFCDEPLEELEGSDYSIELWAKSHEVREATFLSLVTQEYDPKSGLLAIHHAALIEYLSDRPGARRATRYRYLHRNPPSRLHATGTTMYSEDPYVVNRWDHLVVAKEGSEMRMFINGELSETANDDSQMVGGVKVLLGRLKFKGDGRPSEIRELRGQLDELAIYSRALNETEIRAHFELVPPISKTGTKKP